MAFPRAEVGNRVMIKRHASCSETPRFWGSSSNYNGDTVPFPSQHTTKGSVKRMPRSAHCSTAAGASHLLYPLSLKHPACRQAEKSIPFQYLKQQHVTRFLTPECDFLAGPYLLTSNFPDFWGRTCLHPENLCHLCKNRTIWAKEKVPAMHQGEHRHVGIQQVISIHSPFRRGGRKSRENTSEKCFPNTVLSSKSHQKLKKGKKKKSDHTSFKFHHLNFALELHSAWTKPLVKAHSVRWLETSNIKLLKTVEKLLSEMPTGAAGREEQESLGLSGDTSPTASCAPLQQNHWGWATA